MFLIFSQYEERMAREHIPIKIKKAIRDRGQNECRKCYRRECLTIHHIQMVMDGGTNDPDNLILLCSACHQEWHLVNDQWRDLEFEEWLDIPPFVLLLRWFILEDTENLSFSQAKHILYRTFFTFHDKTQPLP